ncbi:MAG: BatD family protein [Marinilabiliaceae bacterium]|nr:BatD family protein [Marinilabiliaceae bacterium]
MNRIRTLLTLLCIVVSQQIWADEVTFQGSAQPTVVQVGENFRVTYSVNASGSDMRMADNDAFTILMGPSTSTSMSTQIINGQISTSRSTTYTYVLKAQKVGEFTLAPASVTVDGKKMQSNSISIKVVESGQSTNQNGGAAQQSNGNQNMPQQSQNGKSDDIILVQQLSRSSLYEGEAVELTTKVYTTANLNQISDVTPPKLSEFVKLDMDNPSIQFHSEQYNGKIYQAAVLSKLVIIPQKSGKIQIEPTSYEFIVRQRTRRGSSFFDAFFDDVQLVRRSVKSNALSLNVKALPANKPSDFSGGVGNFKFNVSVSPLEVETDNSVQVKVSVSGDGNLKLLSIPKPQFHSDFDTFDPNTSNDLKNTVQGYHGTSSAEYLIIPRREGQFEIPSMNFTYFDPQKEKYVTLTQGPFTINVAKGANSNSNSGVVSFQGGSRDKVEYIGRDLRYLHNGTSLSKTNDFLLGSTLFVLCMLCPLTIFVVFFIVYRKRIKDNADLGRVKMRKANKVARRRLKQAAKYIKAQKREAFFDEVMRALWGYLSDKLTLPLSELTKDNAREEMKQHNIDDTAADEFMELLDACEFARYAPAEVSDSMEDIYSRAENVIGKMERIKK